MPIQFPLKAGDYQVIDDERLNLSGDYGDLDASNIIDPQEYDTTQVVARQYQQQQTEKPSAGNWFNLSETEGSTNSNNNRNYWSINKDVVFYLIQAGKTDGVVWTFMVAPLSITITKNMDYNVEPNWGSKERTVTYGGTAMKKISLGEILIEGLATKVNITKKINNLESLLDPVQYKKHIAPLVFELIVKPKGGLSSESRSYGYYLVTDISINELLRDHSGRPLRVVASIELQEVPKYQINDGRDLTLPKNLIVKVNKEAKDQLNDEKIENPDGSTDNDFRNGTTKRDVTYRDSNGNYQRGTEITQRRNIGGMNQEVSWIEDSQGRQVGQRRVVNLEGTTPSVNKIQPNSTGLRSNYTTSIETAPSE